MSGGVAVAFCMWQVALMPCVPSVEALLVRHRGVAQIVEQGVMLLASLAGAGANRVSRCHFCF